jgi:hypothetical protein
MPKLTAPVQIQHHQKTLVVISPQFFAFVTSIAVLTSAALLRLPLFLAIASPHHHVEVIPIQIVSSDYQQQYQARFQTRSIKDSKLIRPKERICLRSWYGATSVITHHELRANFLLEEKDLVVVGGGVAGYVAAIKAGQEGLKVKLSVPL